MKHYLLLLPYSNNILCSLNAYLASKPIYKRSIYDWEIYFIAIVRTEWYKEAVELFYMSSVMIDYEIR